MVGQFVVAGFIVLGPIEIIEVEALVSDHVGLGKVFFVGQGFTSSGVSFLDVVLLDCIFKVFIRLPDCYEPDGHRHVDCDDNHEVE